MSKSEHVKEAVQSPPKVDLGGCVVCGSYEGELPGTTPRWHKVCGEKRPDVVAKVKARSAT